MTAKKLVTSGSAKKADKARQQKQIRRIAEDACERAFKITKLDSDQLQQLITINASEFQSRIIKAIQELTVREDFADEEVASTCSYSPGYRIKSITEQTNRLRQLFPGCGFADEKIDERPLLDGAEGWFAFPRWDTIAPTYAQAVQKVIAKLKEIHGDRFYNYREGMLTDKHVRLHERTAAGLKRLGEAQKGYDLLVVPCQFGKRHAGKSVRRARVMFTAEEFGLGSFQIGCMLLTHPERLTRYEDLWIDCAGDEYAPSGDGEFSSCLSFSFSEGWLNFVSYCVSYPSESFGSSSAFSAA